ncbi:hypothetical protein [Congregibacter sp.]|uniref:hypothetical protein n=1 Tax=Congregibacter sp. TaxID=2744308 RepID=UPI003F6C8C7D
MDNEDTTGKGLDWRIILGLTVTTLWMSTGIYYVTRVVGWTEFQSLPTADIGSFFEGAFAPLAFLWLVIGHFMQQKEITANTRATSMQEQSTRRLELHSRRDSYFKLLGLVQEQLGSIAGFHYVSVFGPTGSNDVSLEEFSNLRSEASTGDHSLFIRRLVSAAASSRETPELVHDMLFGTEIRTRHSENFKRTFGRLLDAAESVDTDNMLREALLEGSSAGIYYRIIRHVSGEEDMNPLSGLRGTHSTNSTSST